MFKKIAAILLSLMMLFMLPDYRSAAVVLDNAGDHAYDGSLSQIPKGDNQINEDDRDYLLKYSKKAAAKNSSTGTSDISVSKDRYKDVTNIAFFGLDARNANEQSRSDVILIVSLDSKYEKVKVTSLMRDMYVKIPGKEDNRINAAYAFGGASLALKTINNDFGLDIKNYVTVDFFGLEKIIDKVGGVEINVKKSEIPYLNSGVKNVSEILGDNNPPCVSKDGVQILNGRQAVAYARIRHTGNSDYERTERQRRMLNELFKKIKAQSILKIPGLVISTFSYVKTNLSIKDIVILTSKILKYKTNSIDQNRLPVDGTYKSASIRGMDVLVPDLKANKKELYKFIYESK